MSVDGALQSPVRDAVLEVTGRDDRVRVTHTLATVGWGEVVFVDVYVRSRAASFEEFDAELRKAVALVIDRPYERVTIRWRTSS